MPRKMNDQEFVIHFLDNLFAGNGELPVSVRLWDGTFWRDKRDCPVTLELKHPGALNAMFRAGTELALAEAYLYDDYDIVGDIEAVFSLNDALTAATAGWSKKLWAASLIRQLPHTTNNTPTGHRAASLAGAQHSIERDRQAVTYHYDVSNDFFHLWLDRNMVYSCGYFQEPDEQLDAAQERKLDYICRKLHLRKGQRLLDIGCGWGSLVMHAARHYGVDATGVTLSQPQADLANQRIADAGLTHRARVEVLDYRQAAVTDGPVYDAISSVGMFEHVGAAKLSEYFSHVQRMLRPGGAFLNHGIATRANKPRTHGPKFIEVYVFPDSELTPINQTLQAAEEAGFEVRDVESLREHYALTLRHWVRRLEAHHEQALKYVDEPTYRIWRLYMAGSAHGFSTGRLNIYQSLFAKPDEKGVSGMPLTRKDWYVFEKKEA